MAAFQGYGGGSGLNTFVVANQLSSNSCDLANYYCEKRQIPPQNLLRLALTNGATWSAADFQARLLNPLLAALAERGLTNHIDYVVLSMEIPYTTVNGATPNSTTAALFYGLRPDGSGSFKGATNSYAFSEGIFRRSMPATASGYSFLCTMITADSLPEARRIVDQGVTGDGNFPSQPVVLAKSSDPYRNVRYTEFDNALINASLCDGVAIYRTNSDAIPDPAGIAGFQTGLANFTVPPGTFAPGAIADSLTSFGGMIFGGSGQTSLLAFLKAGAAGSYGTVAEPYSDPEKFPDASVYFLQSRGFSLAESYYQALNVPYLGLIVGEPLAAPFARPPFAKWITNFTDTVLSGVWPLSLRAAARGETPVQQIDLFVDGQYFTTVTNLAPAQGNAIIAELNGYPVSYSVPPNATVGSVVTGLVAALNAPAVTNATRVVALARGDRVELRALTTDRQAIPSFFPASVIAANPYFRARYLQEVVPPKVSVPHADRTGAFGMHIETPQLMPYALERSTNFVNWFSLFTNPAGGSLDFVDRDASKYRQCFYRAVGILEDPRPALSLTPVGNGSVWVHANSTAGSGYVVQGTTNLLQWTALATNLDGGSLDLLDNALNSPAGRFYRAMVLTPDFPVTVMTTNPAGVPLVSVRGARLPYALERSADGAAWQPVLTNLSIGSFNLQISTSVGAAGILSTFAAAARNTFLEWPAFGYRPVRLDGSGVAGSWAQLSITKASGVRLVIAVTNQQSAVQPVHLAQQLAQAVNAHPALTGPDGLVIEDLATNSGGTAMCNLRARSAGLSAANIAIRLTTSQGFNFFPGSSVTLTQNLADLRPRNHIYLSAGASAMRCEVPFDTTVLSDGYHEIVAVAYDGSHVRSQFRVAMPVQIQNHNFTAELNLLDLPASAPVGGLYHLELAAATNATLSLFSSGGLVQSVTNQTRATFTLSGSDLGAGLHPIYGIAETADGRKYRTRTEWVRLSRGS